MGVFQRFYRVVVLLSFLCVASDTVHGSNTNQDPNSRLILQFTRSNDFKELERILQQLAQNHSNEFKEALIKKMNSECAVPLPNVEKLNLYWNSLQSRLNETDFDSASNWIQHLNWMQLNDEKLNQEFQKIIKKIESFTFAKETSDSKALVVVPKKPTPIKEFSFKTFVTLSDTNRSRVDLADSFKAIKTVTLRYVTDNAHATPQNIIGREKEAHAILEALVLDPSKIPVLLGAYGVGKTEVVRKLAEIITKNELPNHPSYMGFKNMHILETNVNRLRYLAKDLTESVERYLYAAHQIQVASKEKILIYIEDMHKLSSEQITALEEWIKYKPNVSILGSGTEQEFVMATKYNKSFLTLVHKIIVSELSNSEIKDVLVKNVLPSLKEKYDYRIEKNLIELILQKAKILYPELSLVQGAQVLLKELHVKKAKKNDGDQILKITDFQELIQERTGIYIDTSDPQSLKKYKKSIVDHLNKKILYQEKMIQDVVDQWMSLIQSSEPRRVRNIVLLGPTGVGKSILGREFAEFVFKNQSAFLEVDGNQFKDGGASFYSFFGAPNGIISSDKTAGVFCDYLDSTSKGKTSGVILINEGEKAHPSFWQKMMEVMDTGRVTGGDGQVRTLSNHLIIMTSNQGSEMLFPNSMESWTETEVRAHWATLNETKLKEAFLSPAADVQFKIPPEVVARIDKFTAAEPVFTYKLHKIASQKAEKVIQTLQEKYKIEISLDPKVLDAIIGYSYERGMGVRNVERQIIEKIENSVFDFLAEFPVYKSKNINLKLFENNEKTYIQVSSADQILNFELPYEKPLSKLSDHNLAERLLNLETEMKKRIFGQEEMLKKIITAVEAHQSSKTNKPLSIMTVGTTGTGKTETAKALASALYRSENRYAVFDMGKITNESGFNEIFGAPPGYIGSDTKREFEEFLIQNPKGGVIVFDEISNMGGNQKAIKDELFKKLYSIFEEGKWRSSTTNKNYSLSEYIILCTGNDLEAHLQGYSADDIRLSIWHQLKSPNKIRQMLLESGMPEAFLGRVSEVILMKPLLESEVVKITEKMLSREIQKLNEDGIEIEVEEGFLEKISRIFFTHNRGARSIRDLIENRVRGLLNRLILKKGGPKALKGSQIRLDVSDNQIKRSYRLPSDPDRNVQLIAKTSMATEQEDATDLARQFNMQSEPTLIATAFHEAGHAVVNDPFYTGEELAYVTVVGESYYLGYARYEDVPYADNSFNQKEVVHRIARLLAGQLAEIKSGLEPGAGWSSDLEKARKIATKFILDYGMVASMQAVHLEDGKLILNENQKQILATEIEKLLEESKTLANNILEENWELVKQVAKELYINESIRKEKFLELQKTFGVPKKSPERHIIDMHREFFNKK